MALFGKTVLEKYEQQFRPKELQNKHLFYDMYAVVNDPEELRSFVLEVVHDMDWKTSVNEFTKWEEEDTEAIFTGGKLKPIRSILKAHSEVVKGPRFPIIWKTLGFLGLLSLIGYIFFLFNPEAAQDLTFNKMWFVLMAALSFGLAIVTYSIKNRVRLAAWIKIAGIYDIANEEANVRIIIAADAEKADKEAFSKMEDNLVELYDVLSRRYIKRKDLSSKTMKDIGKEIGSGRKDPSEKVLQSLAEIDQELAGIDKQISEGKMTESAYKEVKENLLKRKAKVETLVDLFKLE